MLLSVQGFVPWYKGVFLGAFFFSNNDLFLFFLFFWGGGGYFFTWQLQNAGETSAMRVKLSWNVHAGESLKMRVTPAQCGWVHISAYTFSFYKQAKDKQPVWTWPKTKQLAKQPPSDYFSYLYFNALTNCR